METEQPQPDSENEIQPDDSPEEYAEKVESDPSANPPEEELDDLRGG